MAPNKPSPLAFTINYHTRVHVLVSEVQIAEAFDHMDPAVKPNWCKYKCIWDTGASCSVITAKVVKDLNLQPTGKALCYNAGGQKVQNTYLVSMGLPNKVAFPALRVIEGEIEGSDALIGMDIISWGDFAVSNKDGITKVSYQIPSSHEIDFVDEINRKNMVSAHSEISDEEKRKARNKRKRDARRQ